jgi:mitogen-activated protein kinase kinase kinase 11
MLINDLVLQVENQRSLVQQLKRLPRGAHHDLVLDLAQLSPRLMDLQQIILTDFSSLQGAQYDAETIWSLITLYVDKLHSVELLLLEDLECLNYSAVAFTSRCNSANNLALMGRSTSAHNLAALISRESSAHNLETMGDSDPTSTIVNALTAISNGNTMASSDQLVSHFERLSADEIKKRILELMSSGIKDNASLGVTQDEAPKDALKIISETKALSLTSNTHAFPSGSTTLSLSRHNQLLRAPSKEWQIEIYEIKFTKRLGQGASATTYLGQWTGQNVAIKVASITEFGQDGWRTEVNALQRLHHPNIIRMMGTIYNENPQTQCLVLEYCNAGDLATALRYPTPKNFFFNVSTSIANAMTYIHSRKIIHRDLKPGNILCDGNVAGGQFTVKVTDFGIAAYIEDGKEPEQSTVYTPLDLTGETGTYRWMSPECIRHEPYSYRCDVYSFAVMLNQFITREEPFSDLEAVEAAEMTALQKKRPPMPPLIPEAVKRIIEINWSDDPYERWDFSRIAQEIQSLQDTLSVQDLAYLEEPHGHPIQNRLYEGCEGGGNKELSRLPSGTNDSNAAHTSRGRRDSKLPLGRREKSWKSRNSRSPSRNASPGKKPSLLSSFFGQRRKGTLEYQHSKSFSRSSSTG